VQLVYACSRHVIIISALGGVNVCSAHALISGTLGIMHLSIEDDKHSTYIMDIRACVKTVAIQDYTSIWLSAATLNFA